MPDSAFKTSVSM